MQQGFQNNLYSPGSPFQLNLACPTISFLKDWSTSPSAPGDKLAASFQPLENKIGSVKADLVHLVTASSSATGGATTAPVFGANHGVGLSQPTVGLPLAFGWSTQAAHSFLPTWTQQTTESGPSAQFETEVLEQVRALQETVDGLRDQMEAESVDIGTKTFRSKSDCATWLTTHHAVHSVYLFVDVVLFMSLCACDTHESEQDAAISRATTAKIRDTNTYQTAFIGSYSLEVPPLLGRGANADATRATNSLATVPTFEDFHPGGGRKGVKERIMYYAKDGTRTLDALLGDAFNRNSLAYVVAWSMLMASYAFWDEFYWWIIAYHDELLGKSNATTQEVWTLISHCVRAIFKSLRTTRACGPAFHSPEGMFWGALQAHRIMTEYKDAELSGHPKIALILHEHLINFSTPMSQFEAFKRNHADELKSLHKKIDKAQRLANQAHANANGGKRRDVPAAGGEKK